MLRNSNLKINVRLQTALLQMYSKTGRLKDAVAIWDNMDHKCKEDPITWTAIISAYGKYGQGKKSLKLFDEMQSNTKPDSVSLVAVLSACRFDVQIFCQSM